MSQKVLAILWIGGLLIESRVQVLIDAITRSAVFASRGDTWFEPTCADDLLGALTPDGHLSLCDDMALHGLMPTLTETCRSLGLSYRIWHECFINVESCVGIWTPEMEQPLVLAGDHTDSTSFLVSGPEVARALELLEQGNDDEAARVFESLAPDMPCLPRFEVIADRSVASAADEPRLAG